LQREVDLRDYERDGYQVIRGVFDPAEVRTFRSAWEEIKSDLDRGVGPMQREARFIFGTLPDPLGRIYGDRRLATIASRVLGPDVALYFSRLMVKDAGWNGDVATHQDAPYFHGTVDKLSILLPLQDQTEASGGLQFVAGSHRLGHLGIRGTILISDFDLPVRAPVLAAGDICLMNFLTWHFSEPNLSGDDRVLMQLAYQPATDGAYFARYLDGPVLVTGTWRTSHFVPYGYGIVPDGGTMPVTASPDSSVESDREGKTGLRAIAQTFLRRG